MEVLDRAEEARQALGFFPEVKRVEVERRTLTLQFEGAPERLAEIVKALALKDIPIVALHEEKSDLEELFMRLTQGEVS
jgi:hypothetical protein